MNNDSEPITAQDYLARAEQFQNDKDYERALADCEAALQLEPENAQAYYQRGWLRDDIGPRNGTSDDDYELALADYAEALRLDPMCENAYIARAVIFNLILSDNVQAMAEYSALIALKPDNAYAYEHRGFLYHHFANQYDAALSDYNQSIELEATAERYSLRGDLQTDLKDYQGALADYNSAIQLEPYWYSFVHYSRGNVYEEMGDFKSAIVEYTILIDPIVNDKSDYVAKYWNARAWAYYQLGDYDAAMLDVNEAIRRDRSDVWQFRYMRGAIYEALNQVANAISDYQAALAFEPDDEDTQQEMLGYIAQWL